MGAGPVRLPALRRLRCAFRKHQHSFPPRPEAAMANTSPHGLRSAFRLDPQTFPRSRDWKGRIDGAYLDTLKAPTPERSWLSPAMRVSLGIREDY